MDDPQDDVITILKALANPTRLEIHWLKEPDQHFGAQPEPLDEVGVCVSQIQRKAGVSQSTASHFMSVLAPRRAGEQPTGGPVDLLPAQ